MNPPKPATVTGWAIALYSRGNRGSLIRTRRRDKFLYASRSEARKVAREIRSRFLCATPIRVRVTIEARE